MSSCVKSKNTSTLNIFNKIFYSTLIGIAIFIILLAVSSLLILNINIQSDRLYILILVTSRISVIVGATCGSFTASGKRLISGMTVTLILTVIEFVLLSCFNNIAISNKIIIIFPIAVISGFIGSITGTNVIKK